MCSLNVRGILQLSLLVLQFTLFYFSASKNSTATIFTSLIYWSSTSAIHCTCVSIQDCRLFETSPFKSNVNKIVWIYEHWSRLRIIKDLLGITIIHWRIPSDPLDCPCMHWPWSSMHWWPLHLDVNVKSQTKRQLWMPYRTVPYAVYCGLYYTVDRQPSVQRNDDTSALYAHLSVPVFCTPLCGAVRAPVSEQGGNLGPSELARSKRSRSRSACI